MGSSWAALAAEGGPYGKGIGAILVKVGAREGKGRGAGECGRGGGGGGGCVEQLEQ